VDPPSASHKNQDFIFTALFFEFHKAAQKHEVMQHPQALIYPTLWQTSLANGSHKHWSTTFWPN